MSQVLAGGGSSLQPAVARLLSRGMRRIFSAGRAGAAVQFHEHGTTWFALTHGRKAWWLGPPNLSLELASFGRGASACSYLALPQSSPDGRVSLVVQEAGEVSCVRGIGERWRSPMRAVWE